MTKLIDHPPASESLATPSTDQHEEVSAWKDDRTDVAECGAECACGVTFDGFPSLAEARDALAAHIANPAPIVHRAWCTIELCKKDPVGGGFTHHSVVYFVPREARTSDYATLQLWGPNDTLGESEEAVTFVELRIHDQHGSILASLDLTLSQVHAFRVLLGVVSPVGDLESEDSAAFWCGVEAAYDASVRAIDFAAELARIHMTGLRRKLHTVAAELQLVSDAQLIAMADDERDLKRVVTTPEVAS